MKKLFSLLTTIFLVGSVLASEVVYKTAIFSAANCTKSGAYAGSVTCTVGSDSWTAENASNNNGGWDYLKIGQKKSKAADDNVITTCTITASAAYSEAITKIIITGTHDRGSFTSKLIYASDNTFTNDKVEITGPSAFSNGTATFTIASPVASRYYKLEFVCTNTTTTAGVITITSIAYYHNVDVSVEQPTFAPTTGSFQNSVEVTLNCETEGAAIYYTTEEANKETPSTSTWTAYDGSSKPSFDATTTIYAAAKLGDEWSSVASRTYTLYPTEMTCAEARTAALSVSGNSVPYADGLSFTVLGYVTNIQTAWAENKITFWIADAANGGKVLEAYNAACSEANAPVVGESVELTGTLTKYSSTPEFAAGCTFTKVPRPYITPSPTSLKFNTVEKNSSVVKTITLSGANLENSHDVTVTAPTGYKVSIGDDEPATSLTITPSTGSINETVKVTAITSENGTFNGNLTISSEDLEDVIVGLTMTVTERFTVSFNTGTGNPTVSPIQEATVLAGIELPASVTPEKEGWTFAGWAEAAVASKTTSAPTLLAGGTTYHPTSNITFYAVYSQTIGAVPPYGTVTVTYNSTNFPNAYGDANTFTEYTLEEYKFKIQQIYKNGSKMQWRAKGNENGTGTIYNTDTYPATISSIILTYEAGDGGKNHTLYVGDTENPTSGTEITGTIDGAVETFDCSSESANYFVLANGEGAGYTLSIAINYGNAGTTYYVSSPSDLPTALDTVEKSAKAVKTIVNGQLFIEKNGHIYNAQGQLVK